MTGLQVDQGPPCPPGPATTRPPILHWRGKHSPPHIQQEEAGPSSPSGPSTDSYECWSSPEPPEPTLYYASCSSDEEVAAALPPVWTRPLPGLHSPILPEEESEDGEWPETPPLPSTPVEEVDLQGLQEGKGQTWSPGPPSTPATTITRPPTHPLHDADTSVPSIIPPQPESGNPPPPGKTFFVKLRFISPLFLNLICI
ncbi:uncharacterized protein LOC134965441 [Pseudophryne corroboree]|uniref:uncharacterized protein LOC134965441 n=1 Tax=Pseudophryne corroboree TaxID=495146 RepID=UPI00308201C7